MKGCVEMQSTEKEYLFKRTKEAYSSYISERLFQKQFLEGRNINYTTGWWISKVKENLIYLFLVKEEISDLDKEIIEKVKSSFSEVFHVKYSKDCIIIQSIDSHSTYTLQEFLEQYEHRELETKINHQDNTEIKQKYFNYFIDNNMYEDVVNEVDVENEFLKKYFYSTNIDFLIKNDVGIFLLEVKYKYRTKNGNFGINKMQYEVCSIFQSNNIRAFNVVLENESKVDILERVDNNDFEWVYSHIKEESTDLKDAPKETSYDQMKTQRYYELSGKDYKVLNYRSNFINLVCPKCGGKLLLRQGKFGEFLGCENYAKSNCKGSSSI